MYIFYDSYDFPTSKSFASYLALNYEKMVKDIQNGKLLNALKEVDLDFYLKLNQMSSSYMYSENVLTLLIYLLDRDQGIRVGNDTYFVPKDIALNQKVVYPKKIKEIEILLSDSILADIFNFNYELTNDYYYKRYYDFLSTIYEARNYDFTYYYFLFFHLEKEERIRFSIDNNKMHSVDEIIKYIKDNSTKTDYVLEEIWRSPIILACIAKEVGIENVTRALDKDDKYALLNVLSNNKEINFLGVVKNNMAYFLISNYKAYDFNTKEAKLLLEKYQKLEELHENLLIDYLESFNQAQALYEEFIKLYEFNTSIPVKNGIKEKNSEDRLEFKLENYYVSKKFLISRDRYNPNIYNEIYTKNLMNDILITNIKKKVAENEIILANNQELFDEKPKRGFLIYNLVLAILALLMAAFSIYRLFNGGFKIQFLPIFYFGFSLLTAFVSALIIYISSIRLSRINKIFKLKKRIIKENESYLLLINKIEDNNITKKETKLYYRLDKNLKHNLKDEDEIKQNQKISLSYGWLLILSILAAPIIYFYFPISLLAMFAKVYIAAKFSLYFIIGSSLFTIMLIGFRKAKFLYCFPFIIVIILSILSFVGVL